MLSFRMSVQVALTGLETSVVSDRHSASVHGDFLCDVSSWLLWSVRLVQYQSDWSLGC